MTIQVLFSVLLFTGQKDVEEVATRTASRMERWFEEQGAGAYDGLADDSKRESRQANARLSE